jgi:hypothetical protein
VPAPLGANSGHFTARCCSWVDKGVHIRTHGKICIHLGYFRHAIRRWFDGEIKMAVGEIYHRRIEETLEVGAKRDAEINWGTQIGIRYQLSISIRSNQHLYCRPGC